MPRKRETGGARKRGRVWWIYYRVDGRRHDESTKQGDEREARRILAERRREIREGTWKPAAERRALTVSAYAVQWLARRRQAGVRFVRDEETRLRSWVLPLLGDKSLSAVTRVDVREVMANAQQTPNPKTGRPYAPRTVLHIYGAMRLMFGDAVADGLIPSTPCTLKTRRGELPTKRDADPQWRSRSIYTRAEAETLISDERIPLDRRVYTALQLLTGMRAGEVSARRWRDYDARATPLGRLLIHSQAVNGEERETKTGAAREVPVHRTLAAILAEWKITGWPMYFGRHPGPDDLIIPNRHDSKSPRAKKQLIRMQEDLERLGLRREGRGRHALRATFLTLLQSDGANMGIATRATHKLRADVVSGYLRVSWEDLCREIAKLRLSVRRRARIVPIHQAVGQREGAPFGDSLSDSDRKAPHSFVKTSAADGTRTRGLRRDRPAL